MCLSDVQLYFNPFRLFTNFNGANSRNMMGKKKAFDLIKQKAVLNSAESKHALKELEPMGYMPMPLPILNTSWPPHFLSLPFRSSENLSWFCAALSYDDYVDRSTYST